MPHSLLRAACLLAFLFFIIPSVLGDFTNGGFETGDTSGWTVGGAATQVQVRMDGEVIPNTQYPLFGTTFANVKSGDYALTALVVNQNAEHLTLSQTLDLEAGTEYEIGFWLGFDAAAWVNIEEAHDDMNLGIFVDGSHVPFTEAGYTAGGDLITGSSSADMREFKTVYEAPGGMVEVLLSISASLTARVGLSIDDAYIISTAEPELPGDYNLDNKVDAADYAVWRNSLGDTGLTAYSGADGDGDTEITMGDYNVWRENFGKEPTAPVALAQPAPEPVSAALASFFAIGLSFARRRSA